MKNLLVLGGGTAGTMAANTLRDKLPAAEWQITVIDQSDEHHYQPGYLFVPFGTSKPENLVKPRKPTITRGVEVVIAEVDRIDPASNSVITVEGKTYGYDQLIIATGVTPRPEQTPGLVGPHFGDTAHEFYTLEGAKKLAEAIRRFRRGHIVVHIAEMPIKCPVAPLEFALLMEAWLRKHRVREISSITFVTPLDGAFTKPVASRELGALLENRGIALEPDFVIAEVDGPGKAIRSYDGREIEYDLLVTVPVNMGSEVIARSGIGDDLNLVPTDPETLKATEHDNIWVLGDAGTIPTSKAGSVAHFAVEVFERNFLDNLKGKPLTHKFDGHANCFIESGDGKAMLLDFNYETEPLTGTFPLPAFGPFSLLKETTINHLGKLAFEQIYWHILLPGRPLPLPNEMLMLGKKPDDGTTKTATTRSTPTAAPKPQSAKAEPAKAKATARPAAAPKVKVGVPTEIGGKTVDVDQEGFLTNYEQWDEDLSQHLADAIGVVLTDEHREVLKFLRSDYPERGETATLRRTAAVGGFAVPKLFELFPGKPAKKMAYIAGLPKPKGCV